MLPTLKDLSTNLQYNSIFTTFSCIQLMAPTIFLHKVSNISILIVFSLASNHFGSAIGTKMGMLVVGLDDGDERSGIQI